MRWQNIRVCEKRKRKRNAQTEYIDVSKKLNQTDEKREKINEK